MDAASTGGQIRKVHRPFHNEGKAIHKSAIAKMLGNDVYVGKAKWAGEMEAVTDWIDESLEGFSIPPENRDGPAKELARISQEERMENQGVKSNERQIQTFKDRLAKLYEDKLSS
jgi:hypothetical protein